LETQCLEWPGALSSGGYGTFGMRGGVVLAHRMAWEVSRGEIPSGLHCCHKCDNRWLSMLPIYS
jgi:hypothetical protein